MRFSQGLLFSTALGFALAISTIHEVKESILPPRGWTRRSVAPSNHNIELKIGLSQPNFPLLEKHLYEVSDPFHERYGQHLSKEEVEALVAPHDESLTLVDEWLASHGIREEDFTRSPARDWVTIKVPVRLAEKMLDTVRKMSFPAHYQLIQLLHRLIIYGFMSRAVIPSSEQLAIVCPSICMSMLTSSSLPPCLLAGRVTNPPSTMLTGRQ